jgi:hypothetical protein
MVISPTITSTGANSPYRDAPGSPEIQLPWKGREACDHGLRFPIRVPPPDVKLLISFFSTSAYLVKSFSPDNGKVVTIWVKLEISLVLSDIENVTTVVLSYLTSERFSSFLSALSTRVYFNAPSTDLHSR